LTVVVVVEVVEAAAAGLVDAGDAAPASLLEAAVLVVKWTRRASTAMKRGHRSIVAGVSLKWVATGCKAGRFCCVLTVVGRESRADVMKQRDLESTSGDGMSQTADCVPADCTIASKNMPPKT